jgi:hypothetical protein
MKLFPVVFGLALLPVTAFAQADEVRELRQALQDERARAAQVRARFEREISELREQRNRIQDQLLDRERAFDRDRLRQQMEMEQTRKELARQVRDAKLEQARSQSTISLLRAELSTLKQKLGEPEDENDLLELGVSMVFKDTPLEETLSYLEEVSGFEFRVHEDLGDVLADAVVTLRLHELPLRVALDLLLLNATVGDDHLELTWRREGDAIYLQ